MEQEIPLEEVNESNKLKLAEPLGRRSSRIWSNKLDFILSVMGFNIGLGNMLRFPYLCLNNGGGAFLIPYFFFLFCFGTPVFLMELGLGQYSGLSPILFWSALCPIFKGIGWCYVINCAVFNVYYNVQMTWIFNYLVFSFRANLPWDTCDNSWNTDQCVTVANLTAVANNYNNSNVSTTCDFISGTRRTSASEEFWEHRLLHISSGLSDTDSIEWNLFLGLAVTWVMIYICLIKGINTMGKVVYVTVIVPYVILAILLVRGIIQPGGLKGIEFYLKIDWPRLAESKVWMEAAQQIFWSLAPCWGITVSLSSHNNFNNDIFRDACLLPLMSGLSSFFAGFVTFAFAGVVAERLAQPITCVLKAGPGLAFNVYPDAFALLPGAPFWAAIFFLLLVLLGLDSAIASFETVYHGLVELKPSFFKKQAWLTKAVFCLLSFIPAIPMTTRAGHYMYQLVDWYQLAFFCLIALSEVISISFFYGTKRLRENIEQMTSRKVSMLWDIMWKFFIPTVLFTIQLLIAINFKPVSYGSYHYSQAAITFGWCIAILMFVPIPGFAVWEIGRALWRRRQQLPSDRCSWRTFLKSLTQPTSEWEVKAEGEYLIQRTHLMSGEGSFANGKETEIE